MPYLRHLCFIVSLLALSACATPGAPANEAARVQRLEIVSRTPAFGGTAFDGAGDYETIVAVAHVRINPRHQANRIIADLDQADAPGGWVGYKADVIIVRPRDAAKASRVLLFDLPNRGGKLLQLMANEGGEAIDSAAAAGTGFTMRRGHAMVWIGWQGDIPLASDGKVAGTAFPIARTNGKAITGQSVEEAVFDDSRPLGTMALSYPAVSTDQAKGLLTVRANAGSAPLSMPAGAWRFTGVNGIELTRPRGMDAGAIYRFQYEARDPMVMGLGMAAIRDVASFLKSGAPDASGQANPLADIRPEVALAVGVSQSGRFLRDLIWQGFNADPRGGRVFDAAMPLIAGSGKSFVNLRFARPGRYSTQHIDHLAYGDQFPFSYGVSTDPVGGATDGIFARCQQTASCPKLMHVDSSLEFWQARASLVVTDGAGKDIDLPGDVRAYLMSSTQHVYASRPAVGICKYASNPAQQAPTVRVLLDRLVEWARSGKEPPASRFPRLADAMLTPPRPDAAGFPDLRALGVGYPEVINELTVVDYSALPAVPDPARRYQVLVPMVDMDGHDIAGVRLPDIAVPLATHGGWNLRRSGFAEGQLCGLNGLYLPFAATASPGDPRRSISQRYATRLEYAKAVAIAARALRDQGLMLDEDVSRYIERAKGEPKVKP